MYGPTAAHPVSLLGKKGPSWPVLCSPSPAEARGEKTIKERKDQVRSPSELSPFSSCWHWPQRDKGRSSSVTQGSVVRTPHLSLMFRIIIMKCFIHFWTRHPSFSCCTGSGIVLPMLVLVVGIECFQQVAPSRLNLRMLNKLGINGLLANVRVSRIMTGV